MAPTRGDKITHAAVLFFHDETHPVIIEVKDIKVQSGEAFKPKDAEDFVRKNTYHSRKVCLSGYNESHAHDRFRLAYIVNLAAE